MIAAACRRTVDTILGLMKWHPGTDFCLPALWYVSSIATNKGVCIKEVGSIDPDIADFASVWMLVQTFQPNVAARLNEPVTQRRFGSLATTSFKKWCR